MLAPLPASIALLGLLGVFILLPSSAGQTLAPLFVQDCPTKDEGVCCYVLQSCTGHGQADASCNIAAEAQITASLLGGTNNGAVSIGRWGCYGGKCLLALNSALSACSALYSAEACTACEPVYGRNPRGLECSVPIGFYDGCCYLQAGNRNSYGFQGCHRNADCDASLYSDVVTTTGTCIDGGCFYISDSVCDSSFNPCGLLDYEETAIHKTCNLLANAAPGASIPNYFPPGALGNAPVPHPKPHAKPHVKPHPKPHHPKPHPKPHHTPPHPKPHAPRHKG